MKLIICGVKKTAKKIANIIYKNKNFTIAGFIGNDKEKSELYGKKVFKNFFFLGSINDIAKLKKNDNEINAFIVGSSDRIYREDIYYKLENAKLYAVNAVSKSCVLHPNVILGKGVIIEDGVRIKKNTIIGNNCLIQKGTNIEENVIVNHNCIIGENVKIANGVLLSRGCLLKNNSSILQRVFIGKNQVIEKNSKINIDLANKFKKDYCE
jgi:NDP-sugar pyrophosphorylase family protein